MKKENNNHVISYLAIFLPFSQAHRARKGKYTVRQQFFFPFAGSTFSLTHPQTNKYKGSNLRI